MSIFDWLGAGAEPDEEQRHRFAGDAASCTIFEHRDYDGDGFRATFGVKYVGRRMNDETSSIKITGGVWEFYEHRDYQGWSRRLGPGEYPYVGDVNIPNDQISSFRRVE